MSIVQMPLRHWQAWGTDHLSRKSFMFDHPLVKKFFPMSTLNLPWLSFEPFPFSLSLDIREISISIPLHFLSSESCRERWGHPLASFLNYCLRGSSTLLLLLLNHPIEMYCFNWYHHGLDSSITLTQCSPSVQLCSWLLTFGDGSSCNGPCLTSWLWDCFSKNISYLVVLFAGWLSQIQPGFH